MQQYLDYFIMMWYKGTILLQDVNFMVATEFKRLLLCTSSLILRHIQLTYQHQNVTCMANIVSGINAYLFLVGSAIRLIHTHHFWTPKITVFSLTAYSHHFINVDLRKWTGNSISREYDNNDTMWNSLFKIILAALRMLHSVAPDMYGIWRYAYTCTSVLYGCCMMGSETQDTDVCIMQASMWILSQCIGHVQNHQCLQNAVQIYRW